ncbi:SDR family NAD(P)-dependent oxidoreductase [Actinomadura spongiicola]|uniref:SDR family NAD(P)-dependent oxidoreductase n=1 Tax=Actinomadura spongiicola TaxID=2303421 RepID=A0A372GNC5_9ACTN|nr:SDR family NAD(P)-dependent oxidoreductase [Actinomadura spongiicola]
MSSRAAPDAGIVRDGLLPLLVEEDFGVVVDTNLTGVFRATQRAMRGMVRKRRGRIVIVSSTAGLSGGWRPGPRPAPAQPRCPGTRRPPGVCRSHRTSRKRTARPAQCP